ncbi:MAG: ATP-dependent zinc metalloprotease FtsH [Spirochaetia bacterium]|nr:ATP-dependent zinc metalloprotease FtsH [Spirochaetia bacterium]
MNKNSKHITMLLLITVLGVLLIQLVRMDKPKNSTITYSTFLDYVEKNKINSSAKDPMVIQNGMIYGFYKSDNNEAVQFNTVIAFPDNDLIKLLRNHNIEFEMKKQEESMFLKIAPWMFFLGILGVIWFIMMRQIQSTGNKALSFGRSRAKLHPEMKNKVTFKDVAGIEEAKMELIEVVDFLKEPKKFQDIGAKIPLGVLLVGPPGTGKTLLARAVSGEAGVPFFSISGSDFVEMFVGVGASRVRDLFSQAKKHAPCIIFIDEIDAVGRLRGAGLGGGHDEREQTLNQLLVEMDGFEANEGIIVIAATNRSDVLDPALLRPGRFDRQVVVDSPDLNGREQILQIHTRKVPLESDINLSDIARGTPGFTGADLANLVNEAALLTARRDKKKVSQDELEEARDKVMMGPERKSFFINDQEKAIIAYHEAGHALISVIVENSEPIHKVSIIPRGRALGITQHLPEGEKHMRSKNFWNDEIAVLMGGRLAEELKFTDVTTGASNDIERATVIARKMVMEWGMSSKIGPIHLSGDSSTVFVGRDYGRNTSHSEDYAKLVDEEVKKVIDAAFNKGQSILKKYRKELDTIAAKLLEKETITGSDVNEIVFGKKGSAKVNHPFNKENNHQSGKTVSKKTESVGKKKKVIHKLDVQPA